MKSFDSIVNLFLIPLEGGGYGMRVIKASGACGYLSEKGITSDPKKAVSISNTVTITVDTYADLLAYDYQEGVPVNINVRNDENKGQTNTSYNWTGYVRKWNAEIID